MSRPGRGCLRCARHGALILRSGPVPPPGGDVTRGCRRDLGCGIGGDSLAFAGAGLAVDAVDADEVTSAIAAYNLAPFPDASVRQGTAESSLPDEGAVWLDPARRTAGHSESTRTSAADWSPSLDWCFEVARRHPT